MAVVFTPSRNRAVVGDRTMMEGTLTFTGASSYATGGLAVAAADFGLSTLDNVEVLGSVAGDASINRASGTFKVVLTTALPGVTEVGAAGDPTGKTVYVRAWGTS